LEGERVDIDDLYAAYRNNFDEKIFPELYSQCKKYCMFIYKKERKRFWNVTEEKASEIMENQILLCRDKCLKEEVECFRRCQFPEAQRAAVSNSGPLVPKTGFVLRI
jgi:hypothetical protein